MVCMCQPGMCHLTITSYSRSTDFVKFTLSFRYKSSFSITIQPRFTLFDLHGGFGLGFWCLMPLIYNINYMILYLFITISFKI